MTRISALVCVGLMLLAPGCSRVPEVRYRVTIEIDTSNGVKSGSSVWSWRIGKSSIGLASPYSGAFKGEAVAVNIGAGQTVFALLVNGNGDQGYASLLPERLLGDLGRGTEDRPRLHQDREADVRALGGSTGAFAQIDCVTQKYECPMFVRFGNISDPKSVERVDPADFSKSFGPGVRLRKIIVTVTDDMVTTGIGKKLGWLGKYPEPSLKLGHEPTDYSLAATLTHGAFRQGAEQ